MNQDWRPKVKDYAFYTKTEDGVFFKAWSDEFVLKGQNLSEWIERIFPYLDGTQTVEELVAPLSQPVAAFVRTLLQQLGDRGILEDGRLERSAVPENARWPEDKRTLLLLKEKASDWQERFQKVKSARLLVLGSGLAQAAFLQAMQRFGLQRLQLVRSNGQSLCELVSAWKAKQPDLDVEWLEAADVNACGERVSMPDLVVYLNDVHDVDAEQTALQEAAKRQRNVLLATSCSGRGVVSAALSVEQQGIWSDVWERLDLPTKESGAADALFLRMLGDFAAARAFQHMSGLTVTDPLKVTLLEADTLSSSRHQILPVRHKQTDNRQAADVLALFRAQVQGISQTDFLKKLETYADEKVGLLHSLHPKALPQIPLIHMQAVVRLPNRFGKEPLVCVGAGESIEEASEAAIRTAFLAYAQHIESDADRFFQAEQAGVVGWSCGRSYPEWYGNGILQSCLERVKQKRAFVSQRRLQPAGCNFAKGRTLLHVLQNRYRRDVALYTLTTDWPCVHLVRLELDGESAYIGAGKTQAEAVYSVLLQAVSAVQRQTESLAPLQELGVIEDEWAVWEEHDPLSEDWAAWNRTITAQFEEQGLTIVEFPCLGEPSFYELGLLVGRIAIGTGGGER